MEEIKIGEQIWATRNLNLTSFINGDEIPEASSKEDWELAGEEKKPAWCYCNNNSENSKEYGLLYNSYAIMDPRGLAPKGWRLANNDDWNQLILFLGGEKVAGLQLKSTSSWMLKNNGDSGNGTNQSNFNALPAGHRNFIGKFNGYNLTACFWSISINNENNNHFFYLDHENHTAKNGVADPEDGYSVRCIKI